MGDLGSAYTLFGNGATPDDMIQGEVGNCWFIAAASAIADAKPGLLEKSFLNTEQVLPKSGVYAVTLYPLGVPHTVVVDDWVGTNDAHGKRQNIMAPPGLDKSIWGFALEKAVTKMYGNHEHMQGGITSSAVRAMIGGPHTYLNNKTLTIDQLWAGLQKHEKDNNIITAGTDGFGDHN